MNLRSSVELSKLLATCLSPRSPLLKPASLHTLCLRTAAIYATTALYEFHDKHTNALIQNSHANHGHGGNQDGHGGDGGGHLDTVTINVISESLWEDVFPLLDTNFLSLVPCHLYEEFLDNVLCALEVAGHYDSNGKNLMQYVITFFLSLFDDCLISSFRVYLIFNFDAVKSDVEIERKLTNTFDLNTVIIITVFSFMPM